MINENIVVPSIGREITFDKVAESNMLVIAFSGGSRVLMMNPVDFMSVTGLINHHRIFLQDPFGLWYQNGINDQLSSFQQLCEYLRARINALGVEKVLIIGTSSGGFAAMLAAHHLKADYAHTFGPQTNIGLGSIFEKIKRSRSYKCGLSQEFNLYRYNWRNWKDFDLCRVMKKYNGKTKYYIHYSAENRNDTARAERMKNITGVKLLGYPYKNHSIVAHLRKDGYLEKMFLNEYLENPQQCFDIYYGNGSDITQASASNAKDPSYIKIAQIIQKISVSQPNIESIYEAKDLPSELALDSVACLELVISLENVFGVNIEMHVMESEDLKSVGNILHLINRSPKS